MSGFDLSQIRAQLRTETPEESHASSGPFRALRKLIAPRERTPHPSAQLVLPLDSASEDEPLPPVESDEPPLLLDEPQPPVQPPLLLDEPAHEGEPLTLDVRRGAFGQRREEPAPSAEGEAEPIVLTVIDAEDVTEALGRMRSSLIARRTPPPEPMETPFHPEDLMDHHDPAEAERLYQRALAAAEPDLAEPAAPEPGVSESVPSEAREPPSLTDLQALLGRLEQILNDEQATLLAATRRLTA